MVEFKPSVDSLDVRSLDINPGVSGLTNSKIPFSSSNDICVHATPFVPKQTVDQNNNVNLSTGNLFLHQKLIT